MVGYFASEHLFETDTDTVGNTQVAYQCTFVYGAFSFGMVLKHAMLPLWYAE